MGYVVASSTGGRPRPETGSGGVLASAARAIGVRDPRVLAAVASVPRERFVPPEVAERAYADHPLPLPCWQTTSQPSLVALMLEALELSGAETVLEVGTGYGYQTALLARLARAVYSVEYWEELADAARANLRAAAVTNATVGTGDGTRGWPRHAPYGGIVVSAATAAVPAALADQLADRGRLVLPLGGPDGQVVTVFTKTGGRLRRVRGLTLAMFVPLVTPSRG